jgi:hypothetical protein
MNSILPAMVAPAGVDAGADTGQDVQIDALGARLVF